MSRGCLVDTSIISKLAPERQQLDAVFADWLKAREERLYLSAITIAEIEMGLRKLQRAGAVARAARFTQWLDQLIGSFGAHILPVDVEVARLAGAMSEAAAAIGRHPGYADVLIGATSRAHDLLLLTANVRHFDAIGVPNADPSGRLPD